MSHRILAITSHRYEPPEPISLHYLHFQNFIFQVLPTSSHQVFCVVGKSKGEGPTAHGIFRIGVRYLSDAKLRMSNISPVHAWLVLSHVFRGRFIISILLCDLVCFHYQQFNLPVQRDCRIMNITNKVHKSKNMFDIYIYIISVSFHSFPVLVGPPTISSKTRQALMLPVRQLIIKGVRPSPQKAERRHAFKIMLIMH